MNKHLIPLLILGATAAQAANYDLYYLQERSDGKTEKRKVTLTPGTYRTQAPLVDTLLKEVGIDGASVNGLTQAVKSAFRPVEHGNGETPQQPGSN